MSNRSVTADHADGREVKLRWQRRQFTVACRANVLAAMCNYADRVVQFVWPVVQLRWQLCSEAWLDGSEGSPERMVGGPPGLAWWRSGSKGCRECLAGWPLRMERWTPCTMKWLLLGANVSAIGRRSPPELPFYNNSTV